YLHHNVDRIRVSSRFRLVEMEHVPGSRPRSGRMMVARRFNAWGWSKSQSASRSDALSQASLRDADCSCPELAVHYHRFRPILASPRRLAGAAMQQTEDESRRSKSPWHVYMTSLAFVGLMISCLYLAMLLTSRPRPSKSPEYVTVLVAAEDLH